MAQSAYDTWSDLYTDDVSSCQGSGDSSPPPLCRGEKAICAACALYHYRDQAKREIDLLLENRRDRSLIAVEVKASSTVTRRDARHLEWLRGRMDADDRSWFPRFDLGVVLYSGSPIVRISDRVWAAPISLLWE